MKKNIGAATLSALLILSSNAFAETSVSNDKVEFNNYTTTISVDNPTSPTRKYNLSTDAPMRYDTSNQTGQLSIIEAPDQMSIRTGNLIFDGLFALAIYEMGEDSVSEISDGSYNNGNPISEPNKNGFFQTGEKWTYVWTRDTSYSTDLAMGFTDKLRALNSLEFKISDRCDPGNEGNPEIIQDTGSGGSWPISTDRVIWSLGARKLLETLSGSDRQAFFNKAYPATINTVETDRNIVYDKNDGLYRGETSFLDWRIQTYPQWTNDNTYYIGMSKALSTNVCHYIILNLASEMAAEKGDGASSKKYANWATELKKNINNKFWLEDKGLYSMFLTTEFDLAPTHKYDLLGESLAILTGVADDNQAKSIVRNYPNSEVSAPVIFPQQPSTQIYHNRATWPFATAYYLRAAKKVLNASVVNNNILTMIVSAAINLSNMENAEFLTLSNYFSDPNNGAWNGPAVNSQRQLWSVAGYISMVSDIIFGMEMNYSGIRFNPFITKEIRNTLFQSTNNLYLYNLPYKDKLINVTVNLPAADNETAGYYTIKDIQFNGNKISQDEFISPDQLKDTNNVVVTLENNSTSSDTINIVKNTGDWREYYAPRDPSLNSISVENGLLKLDFSSNGEQGVVFNIYRNNEKVASGLTETTWVDPNSADYNNNIYFYTVESQFNDSHKHTSQHSEPQAYWPEGTVDTINAGDSRLTSPQNASTSNHHGRFCYNNWGEPNDTLIAKYTPKNSGEYSLQLVYANNMNNSSTGVTCCVKKVTVECNGTALMEYYAVMPQFDSWDTWGDSTYSPEFKMETGKSYTITISDFHNMSYFKSNTDYTGGGLEGGINNRCNLQGIKLLKLSTTN